MNVVKSRAMRAAPWVVPVLTIGIFALDLLTPLGLAISVLYIIPLLLTFLSPRERDPLYFSVVATILTWVVVLLKPAGLPVPYALFNRAIGTFIIWGVAVGLIRYKGTRHELLSERVERAHAEGLMIAAQEARAYADASARGALQRESEASRELVLSSLRLDGLIQSAMDAIVMVDQRQRIQLFNAAAEQMFHCPAKEAIGQPLEKFIPARFCEAHKEHVDAFGRSGVTSRRMGALGTVMGLRATGEEFPVEASISQIAVDGKKFYTVILRDITERKRTEHLLRQSEERYRRLVEVSPYAIFVNRGNRVTFMNDQGARLFGASRAEELLGKSPLELFHPDDHRQGQERIRLMMEGDNRVPVLEEKIVRLDGTVVDVEVSAARFEDEEGIGIIMMLRDISGRKQLQEQLRRTERLAELGTLASGMAHEIGTPMNVIMGRAEHLLQRTTDEKTKKSLHIIVTQVERIVKIMNQLLSMARRRPGEPRVADLRRVIDDCLEVLQERLKKHRVRVVKDYEAQAGRAVVDSDQMSQVLLNLFLNADHAMAEGGTLRLGLRADGDRIILTVADTGHGIPKDILPKIFTPFFTTKEVGKGTGLGLAVVHGIIEEHRGKIVVDSEVGKGTTFTITLPTAEKA